MKTIIGRVLLFCAALCGVALAHSGTFEAYVRKDDSKFCTFKGVIEPGDGAMVRRTLAGHRCQWVNVNSPGGDVQTAFEIGRLLRANKSTVATYSDGVCASACVFLYAAGVNRAPFGEVEIHRPYLPASNKSYERTQQTYRDLEVTAKRYLREMNVSEALYDRMMEITPDGSRALFRDEMESLGMGLHDPVYDEYLQNTRAANAGMSKQKWLRMTEAITLRCGGNLLGIMPSAVGDSRRACWQANFPAWLIPMPE